MNSSAIFSEDRVYRYALGRSWIGGFGTALFVLLNPSTADERLNDPTIRRCISFAKSWGYESLQVVNLFAYRATAPHQMMMADDPIGPGNDEVICRLADKATLVVAAWGVLGGYRDRDFHVREMILSLGKRLHYIRMTKSGHPEHPLYLPGRFLPKAMP